MHDPIATLDPVPTFEWHIPDCLGGALSTYKWVDVGKHFISPQVFLGPCSGNNAIGLSHDIGNSRPHILICARFWESVISSILSTLTSSCKPGFSAHKVQVGVYGGAYPICTYPIPYVPVLEAMGCGGPASLSLPRPNTVKGVLVGMTWGDIIGGCINMYAEAVMNTFNGIIGMAIGGIFSGLAENFSKKILEFAVKQIPGLGSGATGVGGFTIIGQSNIGVVFQQMWDDDGISHDAKPELTWLGNREVLPDYIEDPKGWDYAIESTGKPGMQNPDLLPSREENPEAWDEAMESTGKPGMQNPDLLPSREENPEAWDEAMESTGKPGMVAPQDEENWFDP